MLTTTLTMALCTAAFAAEDKAAATKPAGDAEFAAPVRLKAGGEFIRTEEPGYAAPCIHDFDGDGLKDLIVGQFAGGKMKVYRGMEGGKYAAGTWLEAEGETAEVPGVW